ncbi:hypothetical protein NP493_1666g00012 [Ridgeia piscesae]|uniref:Uncharacterized protein n=1 Tax=Ridgeia piscesae TaxID=27915 RepID=A0AAD9JVM2_RIDPI|nr:hypothetical protein NP493_1666g00012 [Ridgeia piscesae]
MYCSSWPTDECLACYSYYMTGVSFIARTLLRGVCVLYTLNVRFLCNLRTVLSTLTPLYDVCILLVTPTSLKGGRISLITPASLFVRFVHEGA